LKKNSNTNGFKSIVDSIGFEPKWVWTGGELALKQIFSKVLWTAGELYLLLHILEIINNVKRDKMSGLLILIYIIILLVIGIVFLYKGFVLKKKNPDKKRWKIFLLLGCLFTFFLPGLIIIFYFYYRGAYVVICYEQVAEEIGLASTSIAVRKELFNKFLKKNKISQKIYNKIYNGD